MKPLPPLGSRTGSHTKEPKKGTRKMSKLILAFAFAAAALPSLAMPTPAAAGWCYEACGVQRPPPPPPPRTTTCTTYRNGRQIVTECTSS